MRTIWSLGIGVCSLGLLHGTAWSQEIQAKAPELEGINWVPWLYTVVFVVALSVVAFKNSRRTHLD